MGRNIDGQEYSGAWLRNFTEVETRTWWPELQQQKLFHYLFWLYPDLNLEDEGHQWFDRSKWPEDFQGR